MARLISLLAALAATSVLAGGAGKINEADYPDANIRVVDVAIVGGGASGSYAAVRLREDYNQSIVVIEKAGKLGGHTNTYTDPATNEPYDFGVQVYVDIANSSRGFFERFGVEVAARGAGVGVETSRKYVDFDTGKEVEGYTPPDSDAANQALGVYLQYCSKYSKLITPGLYDWPDNPEDVPEDLLIPFGEFAAKYEIEAALPGIYIATGLGTGDFLGVPTWEVMKTYGASFDLGAEFFVPVSGNNSEIYGKIADFLGHDVLYRSEVVRSDRGEGDGDGVLLDVYGPGAGGKGFDKTLVKAKKVLIAIEPTVENMEPFAPTEEEMDIWSSWEHSMEYIALVTHPDLEVGVSYQNTDPAAFAGNTSHYDVFPVAPQAAELAYWGAEDSPNGPLWKVLAIGTESTGPMDAKKMIKQAFEEMVQAGTIPGDARSDDLEFVAFGIHGAMHLHVDPEEMKNGFPQRLYALQGQKNTWYTGAAWSQHFSTLVWLFTDTVLPSLVEDLED